MPFIDPRRAVRLFLAATSLALPAWAPAVTLSGDATPHQWHSFNLPANAFLGAAGYTGPAWQNTDAGALYAEWGGFVPDAGSRWTFSRPTVGQSTGLRAVLQETSGTGLRTGINNIYGLAFSQVPGLPLVFNLVLTDAGAASATAGSTRTVVLRSGTLGTLPDMNVRLNGVAATASAATFQQASTLVMPDANGNSVSTDSVNGEWLWRWEQVPVATTYRFDFQAQVGHMSLDNLAVYASPPVVPAPAAPVPTLRTPRVALFGLAGQLAAQAELQVPAVAASARANPRAAR